MAGKTNRLKNPVPTEETVVLEIEKNETEKETESEKPKEPRSRTPKKEKKTKEQIFETPGFVQQIGSYVGDRKFQKFSGLFLTLVSIYLVIAFTSFFFTWRADHDLVSGSLMELLSRQDLKVENWLGKFGAILSQLFISRW
ncbi:MAG: DNA translocase FtsK 4TM domain-containing protein, partial [Bacteroidota bacterium]